MDLVAFHPRRNPDPTTYDLRLGISRYVVRERKLAVLYNEAVCWASGEELETFPWLKGSFLIANNGRTTEEDRRNQIRAYLSQVKVKDAGSKARWYYLCLSSFMYEGGLAVLRPYSRTVGTLVGSSTKATTLPQLARASLSGELWRHTPDNELPQVAIRRRR